MSLTQPQPQVKAVAKPSVLIIGKLPPPYFGPAIATQIILNSRLREDFNLLHLDSGINTTIQTMGKGSLRKVGLNLRIYFKLLKLLRQTKPDLVLIPISQTTPGFLKDSVFIWIAAMFRNRILIQLRGSNFAKWQSGAGGLMRFITQKTCKRTDGVIVLGQNLVPLFDGFFNSERIHVVPNGAEYRVVRSETRGDKLRLICLSNLLESKGFRDVVDAMEIVERERPGTWSMDVVGDWGSIGLRDYCMKKVQENSLPVSFHPPDVSDRKMEMLGSSDIFIFTPREPEGHPWVIIEAMAASLPIITTDQGAIRESVIEGVNGFLVAPNAPREIAQRVVELIDQPVLRSMFGANSRKRYEEFFTEAVMVANLRRVFRKVLSETSGESVSD